MSRIVVVTGTDTGVGKTVVTAALAVLARARGTRVAVVKAVKTGVGPDEPGDVDVVRRPAAGDDVHELARSPEPLAPETAARRAGAPAPSVEELADAVMALRGRDLVLVEGAGGLLVHLGDRRGTAADLAALLGAAVVVVTRAGLGTLNASARTCEALDARVIACRGLVVGAWPARPDLAAVCNLDDLPSSTGQPVLGRLREGAGRLTGRAFLQAAQGDLALCIEQLTSRFLTRLEANDVR